MKNLGKIGLGVAMFFGSGLSFAKMNATNANERYQIPMHGKLYQGQSTIGLKRLLKQQNPRLNLNDANLQQIILVAKSKHGQGKAKLSIGGSSFGRAKTIQGHPRNFYGNRPMSYSQIAFASPGRQDSGAWKLDLLGQVKVKRIVVILKTDRQRQVALDNFRVPANGTRETISVNLRGVKKIKLHAPQDAVGVQKVVAVFNNGQRKQLYSLEGRLRSGAKKVFELGAVNGRNLQRLIIVATCPPGSSFAKLKVSAVIVN